MPPSIQAFLRIKPIIHASCLRTSCGPPALLRPRPLAAWTRGAVSLRPSLLERRPAGLGFMCRSTVQPEVYTSPHQHLHTHNASSMEGGRGGGPQCGFSSSPPSLYAPEGPKLKGPPNIRGRVPPMLLSDGHPESIYLLSAQRRERASRSLPRPLTHGFQLEDAETRAGDHLCDRPGACRQERDQMDACAWVRATSREGIQAIR
ncbi:unnamed protein product [Pleuronectes platessa]|uniref:Uncharacterized protein n=1 Tax=Pleuronectes platessa TaxID=8262 RepID=A0A9N7UY11_PLEPL|nr:unnamed protein product [Pleuronectes platessa]